ncbi:hypothetical protein [Novosphingobium sp. Leaf2]|uniref:hypothetical protein n=1 Tax=Novosphingobium sp. Leaf2 TaxID=1735670 RepID=UPI000B29FEC0|nr:hypothetical protein [Novosphingobium sp. Leaf2]
MNLYTARAGIPSEKTAWVNVATLLIDHEEGLAKLSVFELDAVDRALPGDSEDRADLPTAEVV